MENRKYVKGQRAKRGPRGSLQLWPVDKAAIQNAKMSTVKGERQRQIYLSSIASVSYDQDIILSQSSNSEEICEVYKPDRYSKSVYIFLKSSVCSWVNQRWCFNKLRSKSCKCLCFRIAGYGPSQPLYKYRKRNFG